MILPDHEIIKQIQQQKISIYPFDLKNIQPASYDLHLSPHFAKYHPNNLIDPKREQDAVYFNCEKIILQPQEFILAATTEYIGLPADICARVEGRSSLGRIGIAIHITAGFIDPGFTGNITLEIVNLNNEPVVLYPNMRIGQICFQQLSAPCEHPYGSCGNKYQKQEGVTISQLHKDFQ